MLSIRRSSLPVSHSSKNSRYSLRQKPKRPQRWRKNEKLQEALALRKQVDEIQLSHTAETEDFTTSVENLKKRILSLEEEHSNMQVEIEAEKEASWALKSQKETKASKIAELETEINKLKDKNRKLAVMSTPSAP